jgi:hypothetical protein
MIELGLIHQIIECIQKLQALNQKLENIKQREDKGIVKKYRLRPPHSGCKAKGT